MLLQTIFIASLILSVYSYFIYPFTLSLLIKIKQAFRLQANTGDSPSEPLSISLIITVHNEMARIEEKLLNTLSIDFADYEYEIIVASDFSDDGTDEFVTENFPNKVRLIRADKRLGKENAQRCAIEASQGNILVFSDVATQIPADAIQKLMAYYEDPDIGAISSEDVFIGEDGKVVGEGAYVKYEMWLRNMESRLSGLVGLSGSFFSCRKIITDTWDIYSPSDFNTALNTAKKKLRSVTAPDVKGHYKDLKDPGKEYQRKVRTVLRGMTGLSRNINILNPFVYGIFSYQVLCHKLMRWLTPVFMLICLVTNVLVFEQYSLYQVILYLQFLFYGLCILAAMYKPSQDFILIRLCYFFFMSNLAIMHSLSLFLAGKNMTVWKPSVR